MVMDLDYVGRVAAPRLESLKAAYFGSHPDDPEVLHRKDMVNQRGPFYALHDSDIRERFDKDLLAFLSETVYSVVTIVIDKLELVRRYATWRFDPYHYCLTVLMERHVLYLSSGDLHGDVLAECS